MRATVHLPTSEVVPVFDRPVSSDQIWAEPLVLFATPWQMIACLYSPDLGIALWWPRALHHRSIGSWRAPPAGVACTAWQLPAWTALP
jgi:hypothetical protein